MIEFNTAKLAKNNTSGTLDFSSTNIQANKEIDLLFSDPSPIVVKPDSGFLGMAEITINHPPVEEVTDVVINKAGKQRITPSEGYDATQAVDVTVQAATRTVDITKNGTYSVDGLLSKVTINANVEQQASVDLSTGVKFARSTWTEVPFKFTGQPKNCSYMFHSNTSLKSIPEIDTSKSTSLEYMFAQCILLAGTVSIDCASATSLSNTFGQTQFTEITLINCRHITSMYNTFDRCYALTSIPGLDTTNVTELTYTFNNCSALTTLPKLSFANVTKTNNAFSGCSALTTLGGFTGLNVDLNLSAATKLTKESILNIFNEAADVTASPKTLTLGSTNLAKLTDEEKAVATNKGWTLA